MVSQLKSQEYKFSVEEITNGKLKVENKLSMHKGQEGWCGWSLMSWDWTMLSIRKHDTKKKKKRNHGELKFYFKWIGNS